MVKDEDEDDISDEEVQARLQALMEENNAEKASMEQVTDRHLSLLLGSVVIRIFMQNDGSGSSSQLAVADVD